MGKWFTLAPCRFRADEPFFWRDSGLLFRELQAQGHDCKAVLLGPAFEEDPKEVLRASFEELSSAAWWKAHQLDGVIMMAWGRHRDTPIVKAIHESGTPLALNIDGSGAPFPIAAWKEAFASMWAAVRGTNLALPIRCGLFLKTAVTRAMTLLLRHSWLKYRHLRYCDVVTVQTPTSLKGHQMLCSFFGGKNHGVNFKMGGIHIPPKYSWESSLPKEKRIIAIGRWDDLRQKRPFVLMDVCTSIIQRQPGLEIDIFGNKIPALESWHSALPDDARNRIHIHGLQPGSVVVRSAQRAQISFFPSAHESGPLAMFECLSCGATTVGLDSAYMPGAQWAADFHHSDLAKNDTTESFVAALEQALEKWETGKYSAQEISTHWAQMTHPKRLLGIIFEALQEKRRLIQRVDS